MGLKFHTVPIEKLRKKKRKKDKKKHEPRIFGLRKCHKCLQTKTLPNFDGDSNICDLCSREPNLRGYSDYVEEARIYDDWRAKFPNIKPCHRCRGYYPPYVTSIEDGKVTCANCFLILEEEKKESGESC